MLWVSPDLPKAGFKCMTAFSAGECQGGVTCLVNFVLELVPGFSAYMHGKNSAENFLKI